MLAADPPFGLMNYRIVSLSETEAGKAFNEGPALSHMLQGCQTVVSVSAAVFFPPAATSERTADGFVAEAAGDWRSGNLMTTETAGAEKPDH